MTVTLADAFAFVLRGEVCLVVSRQGFETLLRAIGAR
jgi:hypothetical protein